MWKLAASLLCSCAIGGGPVVAQRSSGEVALGWQADTSLGYLGLEGGQMFPIGAPGSSTYIAAMGWVPPGNDFNDGSQGIGVRGAVGYAHDETGSGLAASAGPLYFSLGHGDCRRTAAVVMIQLGVRHVGAHTEVFLAPQLSAWRDGLACTH